MVKRQMGNPKTKQNKANKKERKRNDALKTALEHDAANSTKTPDIVCGGLRAIKQSKCY